MTRKRVTERFPWLLPIRQAQRKIFFYVGMRLDKNTYAQTQKKARLAHEIFETDSQMLNQNSGVDMKYQFNKVHNLKLAAKKINGLIIRPGEVFSFCYVTRKADKKEPYRDGLSLVNGEITGEYGGGLCQFSNMLYWMFLHTIDHRRTTRSRSRSHTAHRVKILSRCGRNCSRGLAGFESKKRHDPYLSDCHRF